MSRRSKKLAFRKMRALVRHVMDQLPDRDVAELALKTRCILYIADITCRHDYGRPLMPKGFRWICAKDGPGLVWRPKRRS